MIKIKAIIPISSDNINEPTKSDLLKLNLPDVEFDVVNLKKGPPLFISGRIDDLYSFTRFANSLFPIVR